MNLYSISWNNLRANRLTAFLNILLIAFGSGVLTLLVLASQQVSDKLENNSKGIDLVVGAKGSPLQLILSSIFFIDFPTGNIPLAEAEELSANPMVKRAVPLALGDNHAGYRIVGTDTGYIGLYQLKMREGRFWSKDLEVTIGSNVALNQRLKIGDTFHGAHGLGESTEIHKEHAYRVVGILEKKGNVTDNLILTGIASIWEMHDHGDKDHAAAETGHRDGDKVANEHDDHGEHDDHEEHDEEHEDHEEGLATAVDISGEIGEERITSLIPGIPQSSGREITALLIQYRSPMAIVMFPKMVNRSTNMQAASPALETARLFELIGIGVDTLRWFAFLIMGISAVSIFISLYNSLKERKYDLAIMRTLGASKSALSGVVLLEGLFLTIIGAVSGVLLGHIALAVISSFQESSQAKLSGWIFDIRELYIVMLSLIIGLIASSIPAYTAYRSDISKILSRN